MDKVAQLDAGQIDKDSTEGGFSRRVIYGLQKKDEMEQVDIYAKKIRRFTGGEFKGMVTSYLRTVFPQLHFSRGCRSFWTLTSCGQRWKNEKKRNPNSLQQWLRRYLSEDEKLWRGNCFSRQGANIIKVCKKAQAAFTFVIVARETVKRVLLYW